MDAMLASNNHTCGVSQVWDFNKILEGPKPSPLLEVEACKSPNLNPRWMLGNF